jgi:hypothetical protein
MVRRARLAALVVAAGLGQAGAARAQEGDAREIVRLAYASAEGCPDRAAFEARVRARTTRAAFGETGGSGRIFEVELAATPAPHGSFAVWRRGMVEGTRQVSAETCSDVADALALAVALAIDPSTLLAPAPAAPPATAAPPPVLPAEASPASPASPGPPRVPAAAVVVPPPPLAAARPPSVRPGTLPHTVFFAADITVATGIAFDALVTFSPRVGWRSASSSVVAPSFDLTFGRASTGTLPVAGGEASFTWTVGRADGCILSWPPASAARLLACARLEAGQLEAAGLGSQVLDPQTHDRPWVAVGPLLRGEWALLGPLFLGVDAAAMVHVTDDRFYFVQQTTVREVPLLGVESSAGLGAHFL